MVNGSIDIIIMVKAGAAACAKNASDEAAHTCVANVLNPIGPSIRVAGSSLTVNKNTNKPYDMHIVINTIIDKNSFFEVLVSSANTKFTSLSMRIALKVISSKFPIGVGIIYNFDILQNYRNSG